MDATASIQEQVSQYYGRILQTTKDLETGACRNTDALPSYQREALALIHPEILERAYGCGSPIPPAIDGCTILDLGCGAGRDAYLAGRLVGPTGSVIGVDMTTSRSRWPAATSTRRWPASDMRARTWSSARGLSRISRPAASHRRSIRAFRCVQLRAHRSQAAGRRDVERRVVLLIACLSKRGRRKELIDRAGCRSPIRDGRG
jgi:Methyltransferase domain